MVKTLSKEVFHLKQPTKRTSTFLYKQLCFMVHWSFLITILLQKLLQKIQTMHDLLLKHISTERQYEVVTRQRALTNFIEK